MFDAIVLAGGGAARLGGVDKPQLLVGGTSLLDRTVAAVAAASRIIVVGPMQPVAADVLFCREDPPGGGPVAAVAAGLAHTSAAAVLVLAADLPWIAPAVSALLAALPARGAALLVDPNGRANYLASAWQRRDLVGAVQALGSVDGAAMRALVELVEYVEVPDPSGWGRDCDTWDDLAQARSEFGGQVGGADG